MKRRAPDATEIKTNPRVAALNRMMSIARLIRRNGTPEEAEEAIECEKWLQDRLAKVDQTETSVAA